MSPAKLVAVMRAELQSHRTKPGAPKGSDAILIPFQPRSVDLWAGVQIAALVAEAREVNERLRACDGSERQGCGEGCGGPGQERNTRGARFSPVISGPLIGIKAVHPTMDSKVTALERAFQLARSGRMTTFDDIRKQLKREGYDDRVVADGGRSLTTQLKGLIRTAGLTHSLREKGDSVSG